MRRLRQREEHAGIHARRHQVIARAFRRTPGQHRRLDVDEARGVEIAAHFHRHFVPQPQVLLHLRASQIEVAVLEAHVLGQILVVHLERRRYRWVQDLDRPRQHFDFARNEVRVHRAGGPAPHQPGDLDHVFAADLLRRGKRFGVIRIANNLHQALAIAQVDEYHAAMVATAVHPSAHFDGLIEEFGGNEAAIFSAHKFGRRIGVRVD